MPSLTSSTGAQRATNRLKTALKAAEDSLPTRICLARKPWRRAFREEWALPAGVTGPVERAALARLACRRSSDDIGALPLLAKAPGFGFLLGWRRCWPKRQRAAVKLEWGTLLSGIPHLPGA